ncbi:hypothetical protein P154DRAFT_574520 [Amniculicola lignicola CBS 123094]|uniref:Uncharacterized protein n=1 Tax=Amniculicola lignicola CBS 123094 TaxID=1392246 RepID=A0A6A5WJI3_9PLEO|nr:hypothetical protein P154DRAFT_574520 [Amniculicola lignicola CBS 123094]
MARERKKNAAETSRASAQAAVNSKVKPRASKKKRTSSDEMESKTESQQFMSLPKLLKTPKKDDKDMKQFRDKVDRDQSSLKKSLQEKLLQAEKERERRQNEIASIISSALLPRADAPQKGPKDSFMGTLIAQNPQLPPAAEALKTCGALVVRFAETENMIAGLQLKGGDKSSMQEWKNDLDETEGKLTLGYRVAMRKTMKVLGAEEVDGQSGKNSKEDAEVEDAMKGVELNYDLQNGLRYMERGVKRMVKGLPVDEMEM